MNNALAQGGKVVTMPRFDLEQFLQLTQDSPGKASICAIAADRPGDGEASDC